MCIYRVYDDLNDFLETKERVVSITRIMSMVRLSNHAVLMATNNFKVAYNIIDEDNNIIILCSC